MLLWGVVLKLFGINAPFLLILIILNSIFFALMLSIFRMYLVTVTSFTFATLLPLIPLLFPLTRLFMLQPQGIVFGEGFSINCLLTAIFLVLLSNKKDSWMLAIFAGLMLGLSAYFRSQFEIIVNFMTIFAIVLLLAYLFLKTILTITPLFNKNTICSFKIIFITIITAQIIMLPWRIHFLIDPNVRTLSWVTTDQLIYLNASKTDKELQSIPGGGMFVVGGANLACNLDVSYCGHADKHRFYQVLRYHFIDWIHYKCSIFGDYWYSSLTTFCVALKDASIWTNLYNTIFLISAFANFILLFAIRRDRNALIYFWTCSSFYACCLAIFIVISFETRYFYAMKIFSIFMIIPIFSIVLNKLIYAHKLRYR